MTIKHTYIVGIIACIYVFSAALCLLWVLHEVSASGLLLKDRIFVIETNSVKQQANKELTSLLESTKAEREGIDTYLLTEDTTSNFLTDLENIAKAQGVVLTTNSLEVVKPIKKVVSTSTATSTAGAVDVHQNQMFQQLAISFAVEGSESGVKKMLQIIENIPYHSQVTTFLLNRQSVGSAKGIINVTITLLK